MSKVHRGRTKPKTTTGTLKRGRTKTKTTTGTLKTRLSKVKPPSWTRLATIAGAVAVPPVVWWMVTQVSVEWAWARVAVAVAVVVAAAWLTARKAPRRWWLAAPILAAAAVTLAWRALHVFTTVPTSWLDPAAITVTIAWAVGLAGWRWAPTKAMPPRRARTVPLRKALAATTIARLALPPAGDPDPVKIRRDGYEGDGETWTVHLPDSVVVKALTAKRSEIAGALDREAVDIEITTGGAESRASIWVGKKGAGYAQAGPWPHSRDYTPRSVFDPIDIGLDKRGNPVRLTLAGGSGVLIGAQPGKGKSALMNLLIASMLRDPRVQATFLDFKGGADFTPWEPLARRFFSGKPDLEPSEVLSILQAFAGDMDDRYAALKQHKASKISDRLASEPGLAPTVLVIDEAQELLSKNSGMKPEDRKLAIELVKTIIARGRAVNAWVLIAAQRVTDDEIPQSITQRVTVRVAFKLASQPASQAVLGPDAWAEGYRATECPVRGVGLMATDDGCTYLRAWYLSDRDAHTIAERLTAERGRGAVQAPLVHDTAAGGGAQDGHGFGSFGDPFGLREYMAKAHREVIEQAPYESWDGDDDAVQVGYEDGNNEGDGGVSNVIEFRPRDGTSAPDAGTFGASHSQAVNVAVTVREHWPEGQRGPRREAWISDIAADAVVDAGALLAGLEAAGAPVIQVWARVPGGDREKRPGLRWADFEDWDDQ